MRSFFFTLQDLSATPPLYRTSPPQTSTLTIRCVRTVVSSLAKASKQKGSSLTTSPACVCVAECLWCRMFDLFTDCTEIGLAFLDPGSVTCSTCLRGEKTSCGRFLLCAPLSVIYTYTVFIFTSDGTTITGRMRLCSCWQPHKHASISTGATTAGDVSP